MFCFLFISQLSKYKYFHWINFSQRRKLWTNIKTKKLELLGLNIDFIAVLVSDIICNWLCLLKLIWKQGWAEGHGLFRLISLNHTFDKSFSNCLRLWDKSTKEKVSGNSLDQVQSTDLHKLLDNIYS